MDDYVQDILVRWNLADLITRFRGKWKIFFLLIYICHILEYLSRGMVSYLYFFLKKYRGTGESFGFSVFE